MKQPSTNIPDQRSDEQQAPPEGGLLQRQTMRVQARVQPLVQVAEAIVDKVRLQMVVTLVSGLWMWGLIFFPFSSFDRVWVIVLGVGVLGLLLAPAGVLWLFWAGLGELIRIPDKLVEMAGEGEGHTDMLLETMAGQAEPRKTRRLWRFFRTVVNQNDPFSLNEVHVEFRSHRVAAHFELVDHTKTNGDVHLIFRLIPIALAEQTLELNAGCTC